MTQLVHNVSLDVDGGQAWLTPEECSPKVRWQGRQRLAMDRQYSDMQRTGFAQLGNRSKIARTWTLQWADGRNQQSPESVS